LYFCRNFTRVTRGPETGAYYHPLFQKGDVKRAMQIACINSKSPPLIQPMDHIALSMGLYQQGSLVQVHSADGCDNSSGGGSQVVMLPGTNIGILGTKNKTSSEHSAEQNSEQSERSGSDTCKQYLQQQLQQHQLQEKQQLQQQQQVAQQQQELQHLGQHQSLMAFQQVHSLNQQQPQQQQQNMGQFYQNTGQFQTQQQQMQNMAQLYQNSGQLQSSGQFQSQQQQQNIGQSNMVNLQNIMFPFQQPIQLNPMQISYQTMPLQNMVMMNALSQQQQQYQNMFANQQNQMSAMSAAMVTQMQQHQEQLKILKNQNIELTETVSHQNQVNADKEQSGILHFQQQQQQQPPPNG
jgi:hypothetical protein